MAKDARLKELGKLAKTCKRKNQTLRFFETMGIQSGLIRPRLQSLANTNKFASHVNMRRSQNPGNIARIKTEMLEKKGEMARGRCGRRDLVFGTQFPTDHFNDQLFSSVWAGVGCGRRGPCEA